ncbi:hypothetical protein JCM14036_35770 [Desulfotomaculum defluvii]
MSFLIFVPSAGATEKSKLIIINKKTNQLGFYVDGLLTKVFPVATGRQRSFTPEGNFKVVNKLVNPPYYKKNIPGGSPYNPLGTRWLGLSAPGGSYGIHGNSNPSSIGTYASNGCIRLHNKDILWLYDQIPVGTPVIIVWNDINLIEGFVDTKPIKLYLNNEEIAVGDNCKLFSKQNQPYIPLKLLCQIFGYSVNWDTAAKTINVIQPGYIVELTPNGQVTLINGQSFTLNDAPQVVDGNTFITLSTIDQIFHIDAQWKPDTRELYLYSNPSDTVSTDSTKT